MLALVFPTPTALVGSLLGFSLLTLSLLFDNLFFFGLDLEFALVLHEEPLLDEDFLVGRIERLQASVILRKLLQSLSVEQQSGIITFKVGFESFIKLACSDFILATLEHNLVNKGSIYKSTCDILLTGVSLRVLSRLVGRSPRVLTPMVRPRRVL